MHAQFDLKPKRVSAWQMPGVPADQPFAVENDIPGWLNDKINSRLCKLGSYPSIPMWTMRLELPGKKVKYAYAGWWITCDDTGAINTFDDAEMQESWTQVFV